MKRKKPPTRSIKEHRALADYKRAEEARKARARGEEPEHLGKERAVAEYIKAEEVRRFKEGLQHVEALSRAELLAHAATLLASDKAVSPADQIKLLKLLLDEAARQPEDKTGPDLSTPEALVAAVRKTFGV